MRRGSGPAGSVRRGCRAAAFGALCAAALLALPAAAQAGLLRCTGPDGKTIYTDNKALCPEAKPFQPDAEIQSGSGAKGSAPAPAPAATPEAENAFQERLRRVEAARRAAEAEEAEARRWRDKKQRLEEIAAKLAERRDYLEKYITVCNRGGSVITHDDAGIKRTVDCDDIKAQHASLGREEERAREDLERLPEECRRAGCLPGWLR